MLTEYIEEALERARYELIDDPDTPITAKSPTCRESGHRVQH